MPPSSRHLSHDFQAYKGLTLRELFWIVMITTPITVLFFVIAGHIVGFPLVFGCVGFLTGFILSITLFPKRVARLKGGCPPGHLMKLVYLRFSQWGFVKSPYIKHQGLWQKTKSARRFHV